jgi:hypothetical protein
LPFKGTHTFAPFLSLAFLQMQQERAEPGAEQNSVLAAVVEIGAHT